MKKMSTKGREQGAQPATLDKANPHYGYSGPPTVLPQVPHTGWPELAEECKKSSSELRSGAITAPALAAGHQHCPNRGPGQQGSWPINPAGVDSHTR